MNNRKTKKMVVTAEVTRIEVCRSFSFKLNMDRYSREKTYESRDFFASAKGTVPWQEVEEFGNKLYAWCKASVMRDVRDYVELIRSGQEYTSHENAARAETKRIASPSGKATAAEFERWTKSHNGLSGAINES